MTLTLELFVDGIEAATDFYSRVLAFKSGEREPGGYTAMTSGAAQIALSPRSKLPDQARAKERSGRGVEIVLEVDDVEAMCARVRACGWPLASPLKTQIWGRTDFRVADPDGYRLRITSRR
jgi:catechol 2,3-dioxygenase-like lactoylglutathione lyase family enzyme